MNNNSYILFDGVCNLCNGTVDFILKHDKKQQFQFVALQSEAGEVIKTRLNLPRETDSVIFVQNNRFYTHSDAVIEIARQLPAPWKWGVLLKNIPKNLRDEIYRWITKNRYRWFGKRKVCRVASAEEKQFFPEAADLPI